MSAIQFGELFTGASSSCSKPLQWVHHGGDASGYLNENKDILNLESGSGPNTFFCTENKFQDFELSFKVKLSNSTFNSGVNFRSSIYAQEYEGHQDVVNGPQMEIEANANRGKADFHKEIPGACNGLLWCERCVDTKPNESWGYWISSTSDATCGTAHNGYHDDAWNSVTLKAVGSHISTSINGKTIVDNDFVSLYENYSN
eukprot:Pgem_evm1s8363